MATRVIQGCFVVGGFRPAIVQAAGRAGQALGARDSFEVDPLRLGLARGGGQPLAQPLLAKMEAAFRADFSPVRIHMGPQPGRIGALAFTVGNDIYFAPGRFQPNSVQGQQLLGHELAHVVQQRQGRVRAPGNGVAVVHDRMLEAEADRLGIRAASFSMPLRCMPAATPARRAGPLLAPRLQPKLALGRVVQRMEVMATGSWSGGGTGGNGGGDDRRPPGRWHPDDKIGFIFMQPRANLSGGKHFVPANWIYRLLLQAVAHAETVGRAQQLMQAVHDLVGGDAPLELSSHNYTKSTPSTVPFTSLTSQRETGFVQVMSNLIDRMREWSANIFPNDVASSNDGGGRRIDMPDAIDGPTALRLGTAAFALIQFFNLWCGPDAIEIPMEGGNATVTWIQLREVIRTAITTLTLRANFGLGNFSPNHKFL